MVSISIQAGGYSRRMRMNKALMVFHGQPMIQRIVQRVSILSTEIYITSNFPEEYLFLGVPVYKDLMPGSGALGGLVSALHFAAHDFVVVLACDMPFVQPKLINEQLRLLQEGGYDVVVPRTEKGLEPLHAVYRRKTCLPAVMDTVLAGNRRIVSWFSQVNVYEITMKEIARHDPKFLSFINVNTQDEFKYAESLEDD